MLRSEMIGPDWRLERALAWLCRSGVLALAALTLFAFAVLVLAQNTGVDFPEPVNFLWTITVAAASLFCLGLAAITAGFGLYWLVLYARGRHEPA